MSARSRRSGTNMFDLVGEDMIIEGVATYCEQHHVTPSRVLDGERIQDVGDERSDVLDHSILNAKVGDHGSILGGFIVKGGYNVVGLGRRCLLGGKQLAFEGPSGLLLGEGSGALT
jgi:hypothetical protein